jgi:hypothetical protein
MTMALAAYKPKVLFKPARTGTLLETQEECDNRYLNDSITIPVEHGAEEQDADEEQGAEYEAEQDADEEQGAEYEAEQYANEGAYAGRGDTTHESAHESDQEFDCDDPDSSAAKARSRIKGAAADSHGWLNSKFKKPASQASAPPSEPRKLVIGRGALLEEQVEKQTIKLRRVSKVKGDKDLTALRAARNVRPSSVPTSLQRPVSYAFTATVSRTVVKKDTAETML